MKSNALSFIRLGDIADFRNGLNFSKESYGKGCPLIGVGDFKDNFSPKWDELEEINPDGVSKVEDYLKEGDLLFVRSNGNKALVGRSLYINKDIKALYSGFCIRARLKTDDICPLFLAYFTKTQFFRDAISFVAGTNINNLNQGILSEVRIPSYSKEKQALIVKSLSSIDKKIELNNRINAELEAMAKTLYDYWFVQFDFPDANGKPYKASGGKMVYNDTLKREIPEGWSASNILSVANLLGGGTPSKSKEEYWNGHIPFFTPSDSDNGVFSIKTESYITDLGLEESSTRLFEKNTVFITARGSVGRLALNSVPMAMNQSCYALKPKNGISFSFLFYLTKELIHHLEVKASGSVFNSIVSNDIEFTNLALPDDKTIIERFAEMAEPIFKRIEIATLENKQLSSQRDWLLPMLINGQVTVKPKIESQEAQHG